MAYFVAAEHAMESVNLVDTCMMKYRNGMEPTEAETLRAYDLGINLAALKQYVEETNAEIEAERESDEDGW